MYIGSGAGFKNQDYPVFLSDSDLKFLKFSDSDSDSDFGFTIWSELAANGGKKVAVNNRQLCLYFGSEVLPGG